MDESVTLAQGVASGNNGTLSFWLLPQWHSSTGKASTLKNRRLLEDKVLGCLDMELFHSFFYVWTYLDFSTSLCLNYWKSGGFYSWFNHLQPRNLDSYEISLNFLDSPHQGDKRKKSQQCFLVITGSFFSSKQVCCSIMYPPHSHFWWLIFWLIEPHRLGCRVWGSHGHCLREEQGSPWNDFRGGKGKGHRPAKPGTGESLGAPFPGS